MMISTADEDATADLVIAELNRRRVPVLRFDPGQDFPHRAVLRAHTGQAGRAGTLTVGSRTVDLGSVRVENEARRIVW
ncbi:hypothetical protein [Streptomyces albiaxialis]|uniref:hypothetical protein n=1 Tax=Streptomyces albiaxialis TaxID=329523 RepID=UPI0031E01A8B